MKRINWKYALGEILIVIIGITIAFSMNKCAGDAKDAKLKREYLENLRSDINADKKVLEENVEALKKQLAVTMEILPYLNSDSTLKGNQMRKIFSIAELVEFNPQNITYETLINSGDLKLLNTFELKAAIQKHYANLKTMQRDYERQEAIHRKYLGDYYINEIDYAQLGENRISLKNEQLLYNIILSISGTIRLKMQASQEGVESCEKTIEVIDAEL